MILMGQMILMITVQISILLLTKYSSRLKVELLQPHIIHSIAITIIYLRRMLMFDLRTHIQWSRITRRHRTNLQSNCFSRLRLSKQIIQMIMKKRPEMFLDPQQQEILSCMKSKLHNLKRPFKNQPNFKTKTT